MTALFATALWVPPVAGAPPLSEIVSPADGAWVKGVVPVEVCDEDGDSSHITEIRLNVREGIEYQLNHYISVMCVVLDNFK